MSINTNDEMAQMGDAAAVVTAAPPWTAAETIGKEALFGLGNIRVTPGALDELAESGETPLHFLALHQSGDWGEVCAADRRENELSVKNDFRILSAYRTAKGERIWVITEADRSATTLLLPEEY